MFIPIILATARQGRQSSKVALFLEKIVQENGLKTEIIDVRNYRLEATDNSQTSDLAKQLDKIVLKADGIIVVSPEYNHSFPGEFKMMIDLLWAQYDRKPVAFCGVSVSNFGGVRVVEELRNLLTGLGMLSMKDSLYFSEVQNIFDDQGELKNEKFQERTQRFVKKFTNFIEEIAN